VTARPEEVHSHSRRHINDNTRSIQDFLNANDPRLEFLTKQEQAGTLSQSNAQLLRDKREARVKQLSEIRANGEVLQRRREVFARGKMASGYRVKDGRVLDWAIAEPLKERMGENDVMIPKCETVRR